VRTADFDYELPPELIAQTAVEPRDASRLLVVDRSTGAIEHRRFRDLGEYLRPGDLLVANDSRVINARLRGRWADTGGAVEVLLIHPDSGGGWQAMIRSGRRVRAGLHIEWRDGSDSEVLAPPADSVCRVSLPEGFDLEALGELPLPPYIHRAPDDPDRYQTVYAGEGGSVAAPTAGLHFTPALIDSLQAAGVGFATLTLHVGPGTFRPVKHEDISGHRLHAEFGRVPPQAARAVLAARAAGGRVVAVGTTGVRLLEQWAADGMAAEGWSGWTGLYITPGFVFRAVDALVTNFHLPRSTLLMLVSAFAGDDLRRRAYEAAIAERYRFYSFGDAMLIL
jgi:S-adenosylmethionine:tRNA ribosyltransferase-isomerase